MQNPFRCFNSSPEVIRLAVMMYIRYPLRKVSRSVATRIMMVVCMSTKVAGGGRECYDFCGRWGFDEAQVSSTSAFPRAVGSTPSV